METIGLIAGSGRLPLLFAQAAREKGLKVAAVGHKGETDPSLESLVDSFVWVRVGQLRKIAKALKAAGARRVVMAGGIGRVRALTEARPDLGALKVVARLRSFRDDGLLRAVARYFEEEELSIVSPTEFLQRLLAPEGLLAGPALDGSAQSDLTLGLEVAAALGKADVGQTVVLKGGHVLALEAVEGTDEAIRRGGRYGGAGAVIVKLCKAGQDERFDLPAVGPNTIVVMREVGARVLAVEAGRTLLLEPEPLISAANKAGITLVGIRRQEPLG